MKPSTVGVNTLLPGFQVAQLIKPAARTTVRLKAIKKELSNLNGNMSYQHHSCPLVVFNAGMKDCLNALSQVEHVVKDTI